MLGHRSLQIAPFLRTILILVLNRVPAGGVDEFLFSIFGEPFFLLGPSWPSDPPQRALRPAFGPILRCLLTPRLSPESSEDCFWTDFEVSPQPINQTTNELINQSTNLQNNQSTNQQIYKTTNQPTTILHRGTVAGRPKASGYIIAYRTSMYSITSHHMTS